jgi:manganese/iron transport system substrate-binding protein
MACSPDRIRRLSTRLRVIFALGLTALTMLSVACQNEGPSGRNIKAVVSTTVLADLVSQVGGDRVDVTSLLPPGADPHTFEPRPSDMRTISESAIGIVNGLGLEPASLRVVESNLPASALFVEVADEVAARGFPLLGEDGASDSSHLGANPHLWLSIEAASLYIEVIRDSLIQIDTERADEYRENADSYLAELTDLQQYVAQQANSVPAVNRMLVTTHDAFPYLAREIGFKVVGVVAVSPGQEPGASTIADLTNVIQSSDVPAVFMEPQLGSESDVLERVAEDTGVKVCVLYSGTLDDKVKGYLDLMRFNADELARCLGGI